MLIQRRGVFPGTLESVTMNTQSIYNGLKYTTKEINRNYKIKVNGMVDGKKVNIAVGVSGLIRIVGDIELVNRLLDHAFNRVGDKYVDITFEFALNDAELTEYEYVVFGEYNLQTIDRITEATGFYGDIYRNVYVERLKRDTPGNP